MIFWRKKPKVELSVECVIDPQLRRDVEFPDVFRPTGTRVFHVVDVNGPLDAIRAVQAGLDALPGDFLKGCHTIRAVARRRDAWDVTCHYSVPASPSKPEPPPNRDTREGKQPASPGIDQQPMTADGVPIIKGMTVWVVANFGNDLRVSEFVVRRLSATFASEEADDIVCHHWEHRLSYSTPETAEAALRKRKYEEENSECSRKRP